jgi:hypothetical protein
VDIDLEGWRWSSMAMCPPCASRVGLVRAQNEVPGEDVPYAHHAQPIEHHDVVWVLSIASIGAYQGCLVAVTV